MRLIPSLRVWTSGRRRWFPGTPLSTAQSASQIGHGGSEGITALLTLALGSRRVRVTTVEGDSIVWEAGPFENVIRKGVQVKNSRIVGRLQDGKLVGKTTATYEVKVRIRWHT